MSFFIKMRSAIGIIDDNSICLLYENCRKKSIITGCVYDILLGISLTYVRRCVKIIKVRSPDIKDGFHPEGKGSEISRYDRS